MTQDHDRDLEAFLRQFQPRRPAPLRRPPVRRRRPVIVLWASAAAVAVAVGAMLAGRGPPPPPRPTLGALNAAWRAGTYEAALDEMDARLLPDPARPGGALAVLADIGRDRSSRRLR